MKLAAALRSTIRRTLPEAEAASVLSRADQLYEEHREKAHVQRDYAFAWLFLIQWIFAIAVAVVWSPHAWEGRIRTTHIHVYYALIFGAALTVPTTLMVRNWAGRPVTRYAIGALQMMWSALLIHLTGGRIETHFHIFGSLAFLAFYRDWKVLVPAIATVVGDHLVRGFFWSKSIYGLANPEWWRFLEHLLWVSFETVILGIGIVESLRELRALARRQAQVEAVNRAVEDKVAQLRKTQASLVDASRRAGMAEVATTVLHNVGNVLNSVNVSANVVENVARQSKSAGLEKAVTLLRSQEDPGKFFAEDPRGKKLIDYLDGIAKALESDRTRTIDELGSLARNIEHIKVIVSMQQSHAKSGSVVARVKIGDLLEDALKFNAASYQNHAVQLVRDFGFTGEVIIDRHKLLQILMNLLSNARHALQDLDLETPRSLTVRTREDGNQIRIEVIDNGVGIPKENLAKIFQHGFTTKKDGHGFGLHSSACNATELGGSLTVTSEGTGRGATFVLAVPRTPASRATRRAA